MRHSLTSPHTESSHICLVLLDQFSPVSPGDLIDTVSHTRSSMCPLDIVPPKLLQEAISIIGPSLLAIINPSSSPASLIL